MENHVSVFKISRYLVKNLRRDIPFIAFFYGFSYMGSKGEFFVKVKSEVFGGFLSCDRDSTKSEGQVGNSFILRGENDLDCLLCYIRIELHLPLVSP